MPRVQVIFYQDEEDVPVLDWLDELKTRNHKAFLQCSAGIILLAEQGHEARRPLADILEDGIYELRRHIGRVQYRILYFFHERTAAVLACACTKEAAVPKIEIERAKQRRDSFKADPVRHTYKMKSIAQLGDEEQ